MLVLGIESSCDETCCALVKDGRILSNVIASQSIHEKFGGVVPELASRAHAKNLPPVLEQALRKAGLSITEIDAIAVAETPGLIGSLSTGVNFAKGLASGLNKPLIGVNHIEAHLYAGYMSAPSKVKFPALGIAVSGAHTSLFMVKSVTEYYLMGRTLDDALGETFDKAARILGFPYPGGPFIEKAASIGNPNRFSFKSGLVPGYNFSFSGLKTALLYALKGQNSNEQTPSLLHSPEDINDLAASFQKAAFLNLVKKSLEIVKRFSCGSVIAGGGVCSNLYLRKQLEETIDVPVLFPEQSLCGDNAAMIAALGSEYLKIPYNERVVLPCARPLWKKCDDSALS